MTYIETRLYKEELFMFSVNKVAAKEVPQWVPLKQKVVKNVCGLNSSTFLHNSQGGNSLTFATAALMSSNFLRPPDSQTNFFKDSK